jgi:SAM-dependent methyltransferase
MREADDSVACRICSAATSDAGVVVGRFARREFHLRRCAACGYAFVANPVTDYDTIYSAEYYAGCGADPLVDYTGEVEYPSETIRRYEWRGLVKAVTALVPLSRRTRWLDFGCGTGGLVRYCREVSGADARGFDQGEAARLSRAAGTPLIDVSELEEASGTFDVVTAIEVLEHLIDPIAELGRIRRLLSPGGLFLYTTGNAEPHRDHLDRWRYVTPEIHVSFFEPRTLSLALRKTGFAPDFRGLLPGFEDVIRFKVLKNLGRKRRSRLEALVPWRVVSRLIDRRLGITAHPIGWAR